MTNVLAKPPWDHCYYVRPGYLMSTATNSIENIKNFEVRDDDVFIASYPRSGTYWLTRVVRAIKTLNKSTMDVDHAIMDDLFFTLSWKPFPDSPDSSKYSSALDKYNKCSTSSPRTIGFQMLPEFLPTQYYEKKPKTIYLHRNPKDVAVSWYFYHLTSNFLGKPTSWEQYFEEFLKGNVEKGSPFENIKQWCKYKNNPDLLWIKYEDMLKDPKNEYYKVARFLDRPMSEEEMKVVMHVCDINYMKQFFKRDPFAQNIMTEGHKYVRQGNTGDWKNYFTVAQNEAFDKVYHEEMKGYEDLIYQF
ncbi:sulfotransferase 1B1-like [Saccoglossus kowalevskii]|uniref:Sulfotransferase family cytosolic 1B member 1-like n=1 Tax=Saccoglossus kowalevskii TaxID=10224 RepID=A0ABM0GTK4_SACKO|nr:PREDICTED: sulfotransferase family cytosolic 1B member 1-like [Saccoglossus kowalevskii]